MIAMEMFGRGRPMVLKVLHMQEQEECIRGMAHASLFESDLK